MNDNVTTVLWSDIMCDFVSDNVVIILAPTTPRDLKLSVGSEVIHDGRIRWMYRISWEVCTLYYRI